MTGHFNTEAIVLSSMDYGESDKIVTFYTLEFGKIKGIAKGAKRSRKRFVNNLEPFSYIRLLFFQKHGRDLVMLEQADIIRRFDSLLMEIYRIAFGSYCLELLNEMTPEGQKNQKAFELLLKSLIILDKGVNIRNIVVSFEMKLLTILGYYPHLEACVVCKKPSARAGSAETKIFFSSVRSGILCLDCRDVESSLIPVFPGTIKFLMLAAKTDVDKAERMIMPDWAAEECKEIMDDFLRHQLGKELKSKRFLKKIEIMDYKR
jgi:DNA repair protein RecO (recombination protein O)